MTLTSRITLILDEGSATGATAASGTVSIAPSQRFPDPADQLIVGEEPVTATFAGAGFPSVELYPNDLIGPQQGGGTPGWTYTISYDGGFPDPPDAWSFYLLSTGGATQRLSDLEAVPAAQAGALTLPAPLTGPSSTSQVLGLAALVPLTTEWVSQGSGGVQLGTDLGGTNNAPQVIGTHLASPLPVAQGGTGAATAVAAAVLAGPVSGSATGPSFRTLALTDIPEVLNYRGQVLYATTYNPGDVVLYGGQRVYITATVTTGSGTNGLSIPFISSSGYVALSSLGIYYAADYGVTANGSTDDWAALQNLLILLRSLTTNSFNGFRVILPGGTLALSKTIILPTETALEGQGIYATALKITSGANCDVLQPEVFNSSSQAALLTPLQSTLTASNLRNAFRWGLRHLTLHGNAASQTPGTYKHGLSITTNPLTATTGSDPDFDPAGWVEDVQFRNCSGDGFFHNGRSAVRLEGCIAWFNQGNGYTPSFDTQFSACQSGFNGAAGWYLNHGANQASACKSYNNGTVNAWATGSNYSVNTRVLSSGAFYDAINPLTNDTTAPASDPTNWAAVTATSPAAWGAGVYMDSNAGEVTFQCDCQENSANNWHFHNCQNIGIQAAGVSYAPNWNQGTSLPNSTNPSNYAAVCVDGSNAILANIACGDASGHTSTSFRLRILNSSTRNDLALTGDLNATFLTSDSLTLLGSGNSVRYNGTSLTSTLAAENDVAISAPGNGQVLAYNSGTGKWQNTSAGGTFNGGIFGDGSDGAVVLDGTTAFTGFATLSGSTYTLKREMFAASLTINSGVTLVVANNAVFCQASVTNNGTIANNGNSASTFTGGATSTGGSQYSALGAGGAGGAGQVGAGTAASVIGFRVATGSGGTGGTGSGGAGGAGVSASTANTAWYKVPARVLAALADSNAGSGTAAALCGGGGGGGGGGDTTNRGGGGGGGGGIVMVVAPGFTNSATGTLSAVGGNGAAGVAGNASGGGAGGGGVILVLTQSAWTNSGTTAVTPGSVGAASGTGAAGGTGTSGSVVNVILV